MATSAGAIGASRRCGATGRGARTRRGRRGHTLPTAGAAPAAFRSLTPHDAWLRDVEAVRDAIERGDIYQANLTRRLEAPFDGDPWPVFRRLRTGDPALFAGYPRPRRRRPPPDGRARCCPRRPSRSCRSTARACVSTDPIKGTRPRGRTREQDRALARELLASPKDQAENVMIVDVLRNDLGRVCEPGSVRVPRLLRLERTAAVQHLVTTVTGRLRPDADAFDLLAAAFPGGSITGAPKIRAMELIERLEPVRRGPYCGTLLWLGPDGRMGSSILIRTFVADGERLTLHVGGGITWRSDPEDEWDETVAKARGPLSSIGAVEVAVVSAAGTGPRHVWVNGELLPADAPHLSAFDRGFQLGDGLFETLRARGGHVTELAEHVARLRRSAGRARHRAARRARADAPAGHRGAARGRGPGRPRRRRLAPDHRLPRRVGVAWPAAAARRDARRDDRDPGVAGGAAPGGPPRTRPVAGRLDACAATRRTRS